jgi:CrcB protein
MNLLLNCLAVGAGGTLGALCRWAVTAACAHLLPRGFPFGTFLINLSGSFLLGLFVGRIARGWAVPQPAQLAVTVGFLGAYTTFSTFMFESATLLRTGAEFRAALYLLGSLALGLLAVRLGLHTGARL